MRRAAMLVALGTAALSGCSTLTRAVNDDPAATLEAGVLALDAQNYDRARMLLEPLYLERWDEPVGRRAMLALIAGEIDTRNPERRLWAAADLAARLLNVPDLEPWIVPVAESYYVIAMELGAQEERLARSGGTAGSPVQGGVVNRALPAAPDATVPARLRAVANERNELRRQVAQLEEQLAARAEELRVTKVELERIKKTIKP